MTRFIYDTASSLNGFIADDQHSLEWLFTVPDGTEPTPDLLPANPGVAVMGSSTYAWLLEHEDFLDDPHSWDSAFGDKIVYVLTHRDLPAPEAAPLRFRAGPVEQIVAELRAAAGDRDVWIMGGGDLVGQFDEAGALDEIAVSFAPAVLPGGADLLPRRIGADRLELVSAVKSGPFARLRYIVRRPV